MSLNFGRFKKVLEIVFDHSFKVKTLLPSGFTLVAVYVSTGQVAGTQFDTTPLKLNPLWGVIVFLCFLVYSLGEKQAYHHFHPLHFEKFKIVREFFISETGYGLRIKEQNIVSAKIFDSNVLSIKHSNNRVENSFLKYKLLGYNFKLSSPIDIEQMVTCDCVQNTDSDLSFRVKFPPQAPNTVLGYKLDFSYEHAQFKSHDEVLEAYNNRHINRMYCISGKRIKRPTAEMEITHIFPPDYRVESDVFVSNFDGEMSALKEELRRTLNVRIDHNSQQIITFKVNNPLVGVLYALTWTPPRI
jgi:hypothetical protein